MFLKVLYKTGEMSYNIYKAVRAEADNNLNGVDRMSENVKPKYKRVLLKLSGEALAPNEEARRAAADAAAIGAINCFFMLLTILSEFC